MLSLLIELDYRALHDRPLFRQSLPHLFADFLGGSVYQRVRPAFMIALPEVGIVQHTGELANQAPNDRVGPTSRGEPRRPNGRLQLWVSGFTNGRDIRELAFP